MKARRRFAQHFLETAWVRKLVELLALDPADAILEIGPGRGALTTLMAERSQTVTAVEIDRDLARALTRSVPSNVTVIEGDVLRIDLPALVSELAARAGPGGRVRLVGNLPYNISSPILYRIMALARSGVPLRDATVMLQREVADRVTARPATGDWGPLAIAIQLRADARRLLALPPGAFRPSPKVNSAVVQLSFRPTAVPVGDEILFDSLVRALFGQRRKMLVNSLRAFASARGLEAEGLLASAHLDPARRPETLGLDELARLAATVADAPGR